MKKIVFVFAFLLTISFQISAQIQAKNTAKANGYTRNTIISTTKGGLWYDTLTWVGNKIPTSVDDVFIDGQVKVDSLAECMNLTISNTGILYDSADAPNIAALSIFQNFENSGVIRSMNTGLNIYIFGNLTNNGYWFPQTTLKVYLSGGKNHFLLQSDSAILKSNYLYLNQPGDSLTLLSDCSISGVQFILNDNIINCGSYSLIGSSSIIQDGSILSENGKLTNLDLWNVLLYGKIQLNGIRIKDVVDSFGETYNLDSLTNIGNVSSTFIVHNRFINNGIIFQNPPSVFNINVLNDLTNDGIWSPTKTLFNPNGSASISTNSGSPIKGNRFEMTREVPGDTVKLLSDLTISVGYMDIGFSTIILSNKKLTLDNTPSNSNGYMISDSGCVKAINSNLGMFDIWGTIKIEGNLRCSQITNFKDNLVVVDSMTLTQGGFRCKNLSNYGTIYRTNSAYDVVILEGDFVNAGAFEIFTVLINGPADQNIYLNHTINSQMWFVNDLPPWGEFLFYKNGIPYDTVGFFDSLTINDVGIYYYRGIYGADTLFSRTINVEYLSSVNIEEIIPTQLKEFLLQQNYPNPFNPSTVISYQLPVSGLVYLKVYDVLGNEVATLVDDYKNAGTYEVEFNAAKLSSGVYFYRLQAGDFAQTRKMILLK